ncbi:rcc1 and btb domain-containing protein 1 [Lasius niger]|uniref:Rcc1 and btb domain-containing protein 1 n=1 Tax=Lasius niger TaxID=67767 RepID=A0A0J7KXF1_LASNI|nr:rcc1 and btb domain-containing protein 1 [Lasius niger]
MVMVYGSGGNRALIVTKDKDVYTLDHNKDDNLQTGATHIGLYPRKIEELCGKNIRTFACNSYLVLALTEEGEVYSWGFNKKRKSDDGSHTPVFSATPTRVAGLSDKRIVDIACGSGHSLALTSDGMVYAWGENNLGQVGNENSSIFDGSLPRQVKHELEGKKIEHIACGSMFNMVVTDKGKLYGWGNNKNGQISIDNATSSFTTSFTAPAFTAPSFTAPSFTTAPFTTTPFTTSSFTAPSFTSHFSTSKSTSCIYSPNPPPVYPSCFGQQTTVSVNKTTSNNVEPQKYYVYPHEITAVSGKAIVKVACGFEHTLALTDEGKIYAWGKNDNGQVGVNNKLKTSAPVMVNLPEMGKVLDIAAYGYLSVAIGSNETVYVWGDCFGQDINTPFPTEFSRIHDAFAYSKWRVMYKPLNVSMDDYEYVEEVLNILKSLGAGFDDPSTSDFTIQVEGQPIHVHKGILQIRCQHFKNKFQSDWSVDDQGVPVVYTVSNKFSYIVYKAFLKYLYTGKVDLPSENALELMKLADEYRETNLKRECGRIIEQAITASNVAFFYSKAIECNAKEFEEFCFQFALCNMKKVILSEDYIKLDMNTKDNFMRRAANANAFRT